MQADGGLVHLAKNTALPLSYRIADKTRIHVAYPKDSNTQDRDWADKDLQTAVRPFNDPWQPDR